MPKKLFGEGLLIKGLMSFINNFFYQTYVSGCGLVVILAPCLVGNDFISMNVRSSIGLSYLLNVSKLVHPAMTISGICPSVSL